MSTPVPIFVPYHMGERGVAVGAGPLRLFELGAAAAVGAIPGSEVHVRPAEGATPGPAAVNRALAAAVSEAVVRSLLPVVLAGNCNSCLGALAGMDGRRPGIVWLDAHGDFHTPETSRSGFLDGMALAAALGHCHRDLAEYAGLHRPVEPERLLLLGVRDLEPPESRRLEECGIVFRPSSRLADVPELLDRLASRCDRVYVHIDVDFLDSDESPGVNFHGPGGVPVADGAQLVARIASRVPLGAVAFTNYHPGRDVNGRTGAAILRLLQSLVEGLSI